MSNWWKRPKENILEVQLHGAYIRLSPFWTERTPNASFGTNGNNTHQQKEETQIGIPSSRTDEYRDSHNILDSEDIAVIIEEEGDSSDDKGEGDGDETVRVDIRESQQYEDRQSRKRGLSSVSAASFTSGKRDESPTKRHQGAAE